MDFHDFDAQIFRQPYKAITVPEKGANESAYLQDGVFRHDSEAGPERGEKYGNVSFNYP